MRSKSISVTTLIGCVAMCALSTVMASTTFGQKVYWTRSCGNNQILRSNLDGSCVEVLVDDASCATGLALDIAAQKMYWAEASHNRIRRANMDGTEIETKLFKLAAGNTIFLQENGRFRQLPGSAGGVGASWAWAPALLDIDLDGILDIYVANGFISGDSLKDT